MKAKQELERTLPRIFPVPLPTSSHLGKKTSKQLDLGEEGILIYLGKEWTFPKKLD